MKKEINIWEFVLLLFELLFFILLVSRGGMSIYKPETSHTNNKEILVQKDENKRVYFELPFWWMQMDKSLDKFNYTRKNCKDATEKLVLYIKTAIVIIMALWLAFNLSWNTTFKNRSFEISIIMALKIILLLFFILSGLLYVLGKMQNVFWNYGDITTLPKLVDYITLRHLPMTFTIILGIINLILIKFKAPPAPAPPPPPPKVHH